MALRHLSGAALAAMTIGMAGIALAAPKTEDFIRDAGAANQFEIESAKIAANKAVSPAIKDFARMIVSDHGKTAADMDATLKQANLKADAPKLTNNQLADLDKLIKANAADLEKDFLKAQKDAHQKAVDLFRDYAKDGDNPQLKAFAAKTLPDLENHLAQVEKLQKID